MKKSYLSLIIPAIVLLAASCTSSNNFTETIVTEKGTTTVQIAEKGVSTISDAESTAMPYRLMEDTSGLSLYKTYQDKGIEIGTCTLPADMDIDWVREKMFTQFSSFAPFEGFKSSQLLSQEESIRNGKLTVVFDDATRSAMQWATENGKKIHGHVLIWFKGNPEWMFREDFQDDTPYVTREVMLERLEDYIRGVFEGIEENGWTDLFYAFDIVNEYLNTDGSAPNDGPWIQIIGEDAIWHAFSSARKFAPENIRLIYNENYSEISITKRDAVLELLKTLVDENGNSLVDGIGLQCRLALRNNIDSILSNIEYIARNIGSLELQLTEVDCTISTKAKVFEENLKKQGTYMYKLMDKVIELADNGFKITCVQFSGFRDDLDPLVAVSGAPGLYDVNGTEKFSYFGVLRMEQYSGF